jgi:hypothetical protein
MIKYSWFGSREDKHIHASREWIECPCGAANENFTESQQAFSGVGGGMKKFTIECTFRNL